MKKVVFYGRYSSNNQTEQSIEGQLHVCERFAEQNDLTIVAHYIDRAISGTSDKRPEFQRMISDSKKGGFVGVLVYKLDRFARNSFHSAIYKHKLAENGVQIISATENIADNPEGRMLEGFLIHINQFYSEELSQKVNRGLSESFHKGFYMRKHPPFGYKIVDRKLVVDDTTAPFAKQIFENYNSGMKLAEIADRLNSIGLVNQAGNKWNISNISSHLHNRVYMGEYHYGQFSNFMPVPAIISAGLFQEVQEKLQKSVERSRKRTDYDFRLTGKLMCGFCGHSVSGSTANLKNHYYYCRHCKKENRVCIPADYLHQKVTDTLKKYLTKEKTEQLASAVYETYLKEQSQDERPALEKELKDVENKLRNAINAILDGVDSASLRDTLSALENRRDSLRNAIADSPAPLPELNKEFFALVLNDLAEKNSDSLLDIIVNHIILRGDTVIICINLTNKENLPPLEQILFCVEKSSDSTKLNNIKYISGWLLIVA